MGHAACKPNEVMVKQLLFAHSIPGHSRPMGPPHLMGIIVTLDRFVNVNVVFLVIRFLAGGP